jgi:multidrug efflux pump subunit AcrA (membrane-fusion protein)
MLALLFVTGIAFFIWQKTRPKPVEIVVKPVIRGMIEKIVANTRAGTVNACRRAKLSPSIGGQIAHLPIHEGDQVKAGTLLLEIWNEDLKAQLILSEREVVVAKAQANGTCLSAAEASRQVHQNARAAQNVNRLGRRPENQKENPDVEVSIREGSYVEKRGDTGSGSRNSAGGARVDRERYIGRSGVGQAWAPGWRVIRARLYAGGHAG